MRIASTLLALLLIASPAAAQKNLPVVIDTDIGADIDDAFAIAFALASPELDIRGITTVGRGGPPDPFVQHISKERDEDRAWLVGRFLAQSGAKPIPVAAGADPQPKSPIDWQIQYRRHPAVVYNRTIKPVKESFDTGKQGKEWPGDFEIVDHVKPRTWKAAKSVVRPGGDPWIRLDLKGERLVDRRVELNFKYKLDKPNDVKIELYCRGTSKAVGSRTASLNGESWSEHTVKFTVLPDEPIDEIRFLLAGGELLLDDVLLYTPQ